MQNGKLRSRSATDYKFITDDTERRHVIRVDMPTDGKRYKAYKKFDYEM